METFYVLIGIIRLTERLNHHLEKPIFVAWFVSFKLIQSVP